eukprot:scaffold37979_cov122-Amphora_coffeaeformis.AAC.1
MTHFYSPRTRRRFVLLDRRCSHLGWTEKSSSFECRGRIETSFLCQDNDKHILTHSADARQKLFDSIDADCSYESMDYLENVSVNLVDYRGPDSLGIMHEIARSPNATRLFEKANAAGLVM